ncbi:hypothetical protein CHS0354_023549 [Potamilus streckersoni]|uniref:Uncharacterized protein n=1 Tax=Potamilus streckersoni TaxID=2493646 RepID=A0AAE0S8R7_9BIVA|nr:hypothetical protein CHS0354_023549 [Potamilus streckersoni]
MDPDKNNFLSALIYTKPNHCYGTLGPTTLRITALQFKIQLTNNEKKDSPWTLLRSEQKKENAKKNKDEEVMERKMSEEKVIKRENMIQRRKNSGKCKAREAVGGEDADIKKRENADNIKDKERLIARNTDLYTILKIEEPMTISKKPTFF